MSWNLYLSYPVHTPSPYTEKKLRFISWFLFRFRIQVPSKVYTLFITPIKPLRLSSIIVLLVGVKLFKKKVNINMFFYAGHFCFFKRSRDNFFDHVTVDKTRPHGYLKITGTDINQLSGRQRILYWSVTVLERVKFLMIVNYSKYLCRLNEGEKKKKNTRCGGKIFSLCRTILLFTRLTKGWIFWRISSL